MKKILEVIKEKLNSEKNILDLESDNKYNRDFNYLDFHTARFDYLFSLGKKYFTPGAKFLDIGSLFGYVCLGYQYIGYQSFGLDLKEYVEQFTDRFKEWKIDNRACNLECENIPFSDNEFELVMASEVLEHFRFHPLKFFKEANRVIKPGGLLIITTPNLIRLNNVIKLIMGRSINWNINDEYWDGAHAREFTASEIISLAKKAGFAIEKIEYKNFSYPNLSFLVRVINKISGFILPSRRGNLILFLKKL